MFGIGGYEWVVIFGIMALIIKPEDLPIIVKRIGTLYGKALRIYHAILDEINDMTDEK